MLRDGYVERAIQKLAAALARAIGLREAGKSEDALAELQAAKGALPLVPGVVDMLSPRDLLRALGSNEVAAQLVGILREEALAHVALGREREAIRALRRAERLTAELGAEPS
jgi:hypothetical protein